MSTQPHTEQPHERAHEQAHERENQHADEQAQQTAHNSHWSLLKRVAFRIFFIYLGLYCLTTQILEGSACPHFPGFPFQSSGRFGRSGKSPSGRPRTSSGSTIH